MSKSKRPANLLASARRCGDPTIQTQSSGVPKLRSSPEARRTALVTSKPTLILANVAYQAFAFGWAESGAYCLGEHFKVHLSDRRRLTWDWARSRLCFGEILTSPGRVVNAVTP